MAPKRKTGKIAPKTRKEITSARKRIRKKESYSEKQMKEMLGIQ